MFTSGGFDVERFRFWQGQMLRSRDFRDQLHIEAELRWWHNRALHNTYGIRSGMGAKEIHEGGALTKIEIDCGIAYDCYGRELVLQTPRGITLPSLGSPVPRVTLVARYKDTSRYSGRRQLSGPCSILIEEPELVWLPSARIDPADGVPLAQLDYESKTRLDALPKDLIIPSSLAGRLHYDEKKKQLVFLGVMSAEEREELFALSSDAAFRDSVQKLFQTSQGVPIRTPGFLTPLSRALARPRIESGATVPGDTPWEPWVEHAILFRTRQIPIPVGMQVTIDTSAAGFTRTPCYFAWLEGTLWQKSNIEFVPIPLTHIDSEALEYFRFRLWMPNLVTLIGSRIRTANKKFAEEFINYAREQELSVCWIGIQPTEKTGEECVKPDPPGCED